MGLYVETPDGRYRRWFDRSEYRQAFRRLWIVARDIRTKVMVEKHCFGKPVKCVECGLDSSAVWANTQLEAAAGQGICDDCKARLDPDQKPLLPVDSTPSFVEKLEPESRADG